MTNQEAYTLTALSLTMWRESAFEPIEGIIAVGCVVRERVRIAQRWLRQGRKHPWGSTIAEVIRKNAAFSSMTIEGDKQVDEWPAENDERWLLIMQLAERIIPGELEHPVPTATMYYSDVLDKIGQAPGWRNRAQFLAQIGHHKFYFAEA